MKLCPKCQKQYSDDANFCPVDAARLQPLQAQPGETDSLSARFQLGEKLGGGRTGAVHRATDKQTGAAVAVKLISPSVVSLPGVAQRIERELRQLERVQSAGVAKVLASGKRGDEWWVATELLDGAQTLADAITARGPIALDFAAHLVEVIGEALIEAAQVGVVHRDLAPKNVLFAGQDIKLINFSLPVPATERVPGVPEFVAPEQVEGKPVDQRSNLYSLGTLYYYVLTGQTPHAGSPEEVHRLHVSGTIRTPSSLAPVPGPVEAVIMRALDRSPTKRFLTVRQFVDEVGRVARGETDPRTTQPMGKAGGRPKAELVQTLLGVRGGAGMAPLPSPAAMAPSAPIAASPANMASTVAGVPSAAAGIPALQHAPAPHVPASTETPAHLKAPPMAAPVAVAVATAPPPAAPVAPATAPMAPPDRSPWAPPASAAAPGPMAGAQAAVAAAAPELGKLAASPAPTLSPAVAQSAVQNPEPPKVSAPVVAAPVVAATSGKKPKAGEADSKGKFRETMWFKKGELDAQAAQAAAEERAKTGKELAGTDKADSLPIDERYKDDGSITRSDKEKYSLRTGATQMMSAVREGRETGSNKVSEDALIGEMKSGRSWVLIAIIIAIVVGAAIVFFATR
ncbi:MAG TPA: serine/threonine-protein kinase [Kofleriaceae bacterium]|nr:serine/threonine-protein kinase [Kofleriaceae bacterium]